MLFETWLLIKNLNAEYTNQKCQYSGICLRLENCFQNPDQLLRHLQDVNNSVPIVFLLEDSATNEIDTSKDQNIYKIINSFFHPNYYIINKCPVILFSYLNQKEEFFLKELKNECIAQGFKDLIVFQLSNENNQLNNVFHLTSRANFDLDFNKLIDDWTIKYFEKNYAFPILLLCDLENNADVVKNVLDEQKEIMRSIKYKLANELLEKTSEIADYEYQLQLKEMNEKNNQVYLNFQKQNLSKALDWYYYEYEILPTWYKRFGHIIKVFMGKRSFRSLFSDKVKKYKD